MDRSLSFSFYISKNYDLLSYDQSTDTLVEMTTESPLSLIQIERKKKRHFSPWMMRSVNWRLQSIRHVVWLIVNLFAWTLDRKNWWHHGSEAFNLATKCSGADSIPFRRLRKIYIIYADLPITYSFRLNVFQSKLSSDIQRNIRMTLCTHETQLSAALFCCERKMLRSVKINFQFDSIIYDIMLWIY